MPLTTWWLIAAALIGPLVVFPASTGVLPATAKNAVMIVLGLSIVVWRAPSLWVQAFAAWATLAFLASGFTTWGLAGLLGILAWILVYAEARRLSNAGWRRLRWAIAAAAVFQIYWMWIQYLRVDPIFDPVTYRGQIMTGQAVDVMGWFANPMDAALFLALSLPALAALSGWFVPLAALALWQLHSTAGLIGLALVALWWTPSWRWRAVAAGVVLAFAAFFIPLRDPQGFGYRAMIWREAATLATMRPILGWGPNAVGYRLRTIHPSTNNAWTFYFSEWLQGAVEVGWIGVAVAAGYVGSLAWRLRRTWRRADEALIGVIVLFVLSLISIPLRIGPVAFLGALYLGRLEAVAAEAA